MTGSAPTRLTAIDYEAVKAVMRDEKAYAQRLVERMARDEDDRQLLMDVLFEEAQVKPPRGFKGRASASPDEYVPCGSSRAYQRHRRRHEPIDDACRTANSKTEYERRKQRAGEKEAVSA